MPDSSLKEENHFGEGAETHTRDESVLADTRGAYAYQSVCAGARQLLRYASTKSLREIPDCVQIVRRVDAVRIA
jgi:hypothetical protein